MPLLLVAALAASNLCAWPATAEDSPEAIERAEAAFREGKRLMAEGELELACAKFRQSQNAAPGSGTLLNLADCQEQVGRTATAWATFRAAAALARAKGKATRAEEATARARALEPRMPRLQVTVPEASQREGLVIYRNDTMMSPLEFGKPVPIDPGLVVLVAEAPRHRPWTTTVTIAAGAAVTEATIPPLVREAPKPGEELPPPTVVAADGTLQLVVGSVVVGIGAVGLVVGTIFGVQALSTNADANDGPCDETTNICTPAGVELRDEALQNAHISTGTLIGGGVAAAAGAVLIITAASGGEASETAWRLGTRPIRGGVMLWLEAPL